MSPPKGKVCVYPYSHSKGKRYQSYQQLLFDRQVCQSLDKMNSNRNYYDTAERLQAIKSKNLYEDKIPARNHPPCPPGSAKCHREWIYPGKCW